MWHIVNKDMAVDLFRRLLIENLVEAMNLKWLLKFKELVWDQSSNLVVGWYIFVSIYQ